MSARKMLIVAALVLYSPIQAADKPEPQNFGQKPLKGDYWIYGGELGDTVPPTKKDRKVAFTFKEPLAKDLFDQIGPDKKDACGAAPDHRIRERGDLSCTWDKRDGYICYFGLDVPTGKSTYGSIC
ncbi:hypothetical protein GTP81_03200 [Rugamonas sp. FT107W]|uniref:Uncharacterized protein n=1 Tax=Duganella vulcania TaxID=2692166 RepID=A0A845H9M3_9BURK|nr:hypothetical protein [Duganella vulcania]MYN15752.1 hypothetical protein [Duganella vulcania]